MCIAEWSTAVLHAPLLEMQSVGVDISAALLDSWSGETKKFLW